MEYIFDTEHPFFREIMVYTTAVLSMMSLLNLGRIREAIEQLKEMGVSRSGNIHSFTFPPHTQDSIRTAGRVVDSILLNARDITLAIQGSTPVFCIRYEDTEATPPLSRNQSNQLGVPSYQIPGGVLHLAAQVVAGSAYETIKDKIEAAYGRDPVSWPKVIEYFRHVRNGCFHNNRFNVQPPRGKLWGIDVGNPPRWRTSIMPDDASINNRWVFGDFLDIGDCPILLGDVVGQLKRDGVKP